MVNEYTRRADIARNVGHAVGRIMGIF